MQLHVTLENKTQYLIEQDQITELDSLGKPTKNQATMTVLPIVRPGDDLVYGSNERGEVTNLGRVEHVIYRPREADGSFIR